jgi:hypothetical protein
MDATWNVLQACVRERVPRVVFASTYRLTLSRQRQMAPHCYKPDGPKLGTQEPPHAATPYTASKALGEAIGRGLVTDGLLESFIAVRIGACDRDPPGDERGPVWLGLDDARSLLRRCIESDFRGFHVVYGMSAQPDVPYDLEPGRQLLGWSPSQRAP